MAPDTRADRESRHNATEPATSAGSHDTVGQTTASFGPPKEVTAASICSDISGMSYISPANVGFDPTAPIAPYERPMAPTPGVSPSPRIAPTLRIAPTPLDLLLSDLLPSQAPSSCDFGTPRNFAHTPVFGPSPPYVPKTRGRAAFQARCETASPSNDTLSRFLRDFTTPEACEQGAHDQDAPPMSPTNGSPTTHEHTTTEQAHFEEPTTIKQAHLDEPTTTEQAHVDAFTNWSLYAVPGNLLADFVSGVLKFSQLDKDGNPVFVKDTNINTSFQQQSSNNHKDVNAVHVSQEETRIFVSMDQLRKQIAELQEHDEAMEREADKAHQEKARLELQLQEVRGTCRKASSDSAIGSDSDDDIRKRAQAEKIKRMQKRLDEANTLANSHHVHIDALTAERDELIKECHLAHEHKKILSEQNQVLSEQNQALSKENQAVKSQFHQAGQYFIGIENEVKHLNSENARLRQQIAQMYQQNDSLRKTRKSHSDQIKNLQTELEATRGQLGDIIKDNKVLRNGDKQVQEQIQNLDAELEAARGQLGGIIKDNKVLRNEKNQVQEEMEDLEAELEDVRGQLSNIEKENAVLRDDSIRVQVQSEFVDNLRAELEETRGHLGEATQDIKILVRKNKEIKASSEEMKQMQTKLEDTWGRLTEASQSIGDLEREKEEIKAQRDKFERLYESLMESYTVIHRKLRDESSSTVNSVSSTRSEVQRRRPASIQIKRTVAPTAAPTAPAVPTSRVSSRASGSASGPAVHRASNRASNRASSPASDNEDQTVRPAYEPLENMRILISTTESEVARLQAKLDEKIAQSKAMNKGYSRRTWERLHNEKVALESAIHEKSKIIYHQYDLLEGIRRNGKA